MILYIWTIILVIIAIILYFMKFNNKSTTNNEFLLFFWEQSYNFIIGFSFTTVFSAIIYIIEVFTKLSSFQSLLVFLSIMAILIIPIIPIVKKNSELDIYISFILSIIFIFIGIGTYIFYTINF